MSLQEQLLCNIMFLWGSSNDNYVSQTQTQNKGAVQVCLKATGSGALGRLNVPLCHAIMHSDRECLLFPFSL